MTTIPDVLIIEILRHLTLLHEDDYPSLVAELLRCSLISKSWVRPTGLILWSKVQIKSQRAADALLSCSVFGTYPIRELMLNGVPATKRWGAGVSEEQLSQIVAGSGGFVEKLELWGFEDFDWHVLADNSLLNLHSLTLNTVDLSQDLPIITFPFSLTHFDTLGSFFDSPSLEDADFFASILSSSPNLTSLALGSAEAFPILENCLSLHHPSIAENLTTLNLRVITSIDEGHLWGLETLSSLKHLTLSAVSPAVHPILYRLPKSLHTLTLPDLVNVPFVATDFRRLPAVKDLKVLKVTEGVEFRAEFVAECEKRRVEIVEMPKVFTVGVFAL